MALNRSNPNVTTTLWRMYNQTNQTLAIRNLQKISHLQGLGSMLETGICNTIIINHSMYPEVVLEILAETAKSHNKLAELHVDVWNIDYDRFIPLLRECVGAHQESLECLTVKCRLPIDYLTTIFDFIPKTLKTLDLSDNTSDLEVARFVNCNMKQDVINELATIILNIESPFALKKVDGVDFSMCSEIPKCVRQSMKEPLKVTRKHQMNYRDYSTIDNNEVSSHFMDYVRNSMFMKRLVGMDVRVWWPATKDDYRTSFAGRLWPARIIMVNPVDLIFVVKYDNDDIDHVPCKYVQPKNPFKYGGGLESNYVYNLTGFGGNIDRHGIMEKELELNGSTVKVNSNDGDGNGSDISGGSSNDSDGVSNKRTYKKLGGDKSSTDSGVDRKPVVSNKRSKESLFPEPKKKERKRGRPRTKGIDTENVISSSPGYKKRGLDTVEDEFLKTPEKTKTMGTSHSDLTKCGSATYSDDCEKEFVCRNCGYVNNTDKCMRPEVVLESVESMLGLDEKFKGNLLVPGEFCEFRDPLDQFRNDPSDYIGVVTNVNKTEPLYQCVCIYQDNEELISVHSKDIRRIVVIPWYNWVEAAFKLLMARRKVFDKLKQTSFERTPNRYIRHELNTGDYTIYATPDYIVGTPLKLNSQNTVDTSVSTTATPSCHSLPSLTPKELKHETSSDALVNVTESADNTPKRKYVKRDLANADGCENKEEITPWDKLFESSNGECNVLNTNLYYISPIDLEDLKEYLPPNPLEMKLITLNNYAKLVSSKIESHPKLQDDGPNDEMDPINLKLKSLTEYNDILQKELQQERDKNIELQSKFKCILCFDTEINCVLDPCTHFSFCYECVQNLKTCPICRQKIEALKILNLN